MRILGVDPGSRKTGYGVIEVSGKKIRTIEAGVIRLREKAPLADRLEVVYDDIDQLIRRHQPNAMAVEDVFFAKFPNAAIKLAHVRGVILLLAAKHGLPLAEYAPALVKRTITGRGAADKSQVARLVGAQLGLSELPAEDATDALAIALTHFHTRRTAPRR